MVKYSFLTTDPFLNKIVGVGTELLQQLVPRGFPFQGSRVMSIGKGDGFTQRDDCPWGDRTPDGGDLIGFGRFELKMHAGYVRASFV